MNLIIWLKAASLEMELMHKWCIILIHGKSLLEGGGKETLCWETFRIPGTFQTKSGILTRHLIYSVSFFVEKNSRNLKPPSFSSLGRREHQEWIMTRHFFVLTILGFHKKSFLIICFGGYKIYFMWRRLKIWNFLLESYFLVISPSKNGLAIF